MDLSSMGARIKLARTTKKLTLEKLSEKVGISRNFLWEIEAGRKAPAVQTLYNLGEELNVSLDYILGLSPVMKAIIPDNPNNDISNIMDMLEGMSVKELNIIYTLLETYSQNK